MVPNQRCNWQVLNNDNNSFPWPPGHALITTALVTSAHPCQGTQLAHAQCASSDSHIISAKLTSSQPHGLQQCTHRRLTHCTTEPHILSFMNCKRSLPVHSSSLSISGRHHCPQVRVVWWWLQIQCRHYYIIILLCYNIFPLHYWGIDKDIKISLWLTSSFRAHKKLLYRSLAYPAY